MAEEKLELEDESGKVLGDVMVQINGAKTYIDEFLKPGSTVAFEINGYVRWQKRGHREGKGPQKVLVVEATTVKLLD